MTEKGKTLLWRLTEGLNWISHVFAYESGEHFKFCVFRDLGDDKKDFFFEEISHEIEMFQISI